MNVKWIYLFACTVSTFCFGSWAHIELGAANYGKDGHTKKALEKTFFDKIEIISDKKTFVDELEDAPSMEYKPEEQYAALFWTLDQMVERYGEEGIFHINDLVKEYTMDAKEKLLAYALSKGYSKVIIEDVPGDYTLLDPAVTLKKHHKITYDTAHLKNPEVSLFCDRIDGQHYLSSDASRKQGRELLQKLATLSKSGLHLFILYNDVFVPIKEQEDFINKGIIYHESADWQAVPYTYPEGGTFDSESRVFQIFPKR